MAESTEQLTAEDRERIRRAHVRLRNASSAVEALIATEQLRGRWAPEPATPEALEGARRDLHRAYEALLRLDQELLGWGPPGG